MRPPAPAAKAPLWSLLGLLLATAPESRAADFQRHPILSLAEEYNDNIFDTAANRRTDFITRVRPGFGLGYRTPVISSDLSYNFDYSTYARGSHTDELNHRMMFQASAALFENFLFVDTSDNLSRVSLAVARDNTAESLFLNQTDQNVAVASPYLLWRLGDKRLLKTGYRFSDTSYLSNSGIDKREHRGFAELSQEITSRVGLIANYSFSKVDTDLIRYREHDVSLGGSYQYGEKSFISAAIGNSWQNFRGGRREASNLFWNATLTNDFGFLLATLDTRVQYTEDPLTSSTKETSYNAKLDRVLEHGSLGLLVSYSEYQATQVVLNRKRATCGGFGRWEISPRLSGTLALSADRVTGTDDFPYRFNGTLALFYGFNYDVNASLTYTRIDYRQAWDSAAGARETNRVILEVSKRFGS